MTNPNEFIDKAKDEFDFLIKEFGFNVTAIKAQGTYHSEIMFTTDSLKIVIGLWGQGNEIWIIFFPQDKSYPPRHFPDVIADVTADRFYFREHIEKKLESPIVSKNYPQYLTLCAAEMKTHCRSFLAGEFSEWKPG